MFSRKIADYAVLGFKLSEERLYQKIPEVFKCPAAARLKPEAISTIFPRKPVRSSRTFSSRRNEKRQRQEACFEMPFSLQLSF